MACQPTGCDHRKSGPFAKVSCYRRPWVWLAGLVSSCLPKALLYGMMYIFRCVDRLLFFSLSRLSRCGDARLAASVSQKVHSFDLVSHSKDVVACNIAGMSCVVRPRACVNVHTFFLFFFSSPSFLVSLSLPPSPSWEGRIHSTATNHRARSPYRLAATRQVRRCGCDMPRSDGQRLL